VVELALSLPVCSVVLDGEAIVLRGRRQAAAVPGHGSRFGSSQDVGRLRATLPLSPFLFDVLHLDGRT
jgi:DNA ligase-1